MSNVRIAPGDHATAELAPDSAFFGQTTKAIAAIKAARAGVTALAKVLGAAPENADDDDAFAAVEDGTAADAGDGAVEVTTKVEVLITLEVLVEEEEEEEEDDDEDVVDDEDGVADDDAGADEDEVKGEDCGFTGANDTDRFGSVVQDEVLPSVWAAGVAGWPSENVLPHAFPSAE